MSQKRVKPIVALCNVKGKLECRRFNSIGDGHAYLDTKQDRLSRISAAEKIERKLRQKS